MLLERDEVNPNKQDIDGRAPLFFAALHGDVGVVKMLLKQDKVNPDEPDSYGNIPLSCAPMNGHVEVVEMLRYLDGTRSTPAG